MDEAIVRESDEARQDRELLTAEVARLRLGVRAHVALFNALNSIYDTIEFSGPARHPTSLHQWCEDRVDMDEDIERLQGEVKLLKNEVHQLRLANHIKNKTVRFWIHNTDTGRNEPFVRESLTRFEQISAFASELLKAEVSKLRDALSSLSSYVGNGLGDDNTSASEFEARIRDGIDRLNKEKLG